MPDPPGFPVDTREDGRGGRDLSAIDPYVVFGTFEMAVVLQQIQLRLQRGSTQDQRFAGMGEGGQGAVPPGGHAPTRLSRFRQTRAPT